MTDTLIFPLDDRALYLRLGGILFLVFGLGLIGLWRWTGSFVWLLPGAAMTLVGFIALGYRHQVQIEPATGTISGTTGFYFFTNEIRHHRSDFTKIALRKRVSVENRFSNLSDQTYEQNIQLRFAVVLSGASELEVDSTQDEATALQWAEQLATALDLPIERDEIAAEPGPTGQWIMKAVGILLVCGVLGVIAFVIYQITRSG